MTRFALIPYLTGLALVLSLTSCSGPSYYAQAISGQWKLMRAAQDIQSLVDDPGTSPELVLQLEAARGILVFAESALDMPANGSYSSYVELDGNALVWNVVATEEFSLQPKKWCFVVAGCLPYRGFFVRQKAEDSSAKLRNKGMDVYLAPAAAYSTLGKFKDPLLSTMFTGSDLHIAAYLFHELAHQRLYVKGDGQFNESYASFMAETGMKTWLEFTGRQAELQQWQVLRNAGKEFNSIIGDLREDLARLYSSSRSEPEKRTMKVAILQGLVQSYDQLRKDKWDDQDFFSGWFVEPLNNARLALYTTYEGGQCAFQRLLTRAEGNLQEFHRLAEQQANLPKDARRKWLKQTCAAIASASKL
ncbi:MAG: aminopeptidase [Gammaproteobacteria bacterium]|nr:MAG: aminopeptidase [Gammaproteobacteria bacterium]